MELGYARVSTSAQDLTRQQAALRAHGIAEEYIWTDKRTGAQAERPGLSALLGYARGGDVIVTHTLDRLGRNLRDCLNLVHELRERDIGVKTLADPLSIDTGDTSAMGQVAVAMLSLFSEVERVFARERAAHARAVREASGVPVGRRKVLTGEARAAALAAVASGMSVRAVARSHGVGKDTLYRALAEQRETSEPEPAPTAPVATAATAIEASPPAEATAAAAVSEPAETTPIEQGTGFAAHDRSAHSRAAGTPAAPEPAPEPEAEPQPSEPDQLVEAGEQQRAVGARELVDVDTAAMRRDAAGGAYRVTAATTKTGETVLVGWLSHEPGRSSRWQARTAIGSTAASRCRTRQEALIALLRPHYRP